MQGRLSPIVDGKIQAFPWLNWKNEIEAAGHIDINLMEWTIDQADLYQNPLMTLDGRKEISSLCQEYGLSIPSLTGDCFMQSPFWKTSDIDLCNKLKADFLAVIHACSDIGLKIVVVPLVDNGKLNTQEHEDNLINFLLQQDSRLKDLDVKIVFESDFAPCDLKRFISRFESNNFGINYDIGNSAANGFDPVIEFAAYGSRISNVHVKDRILNGPTVKLQTGDANFELVFSELSKQNYQGNFILQTARAIEGNHSEVLVEYRDLTFNWLEKAGLI